MADTPLQVTGNRTKQEETASVVEVLEGATKRAVAAFQDYSQLSFRALSNLATSPHYFQDTLEQMDDVGVGSLPIILLSGFFIGGVMVLQTGAQFVRFGQTSLTGDVVSLALVRELGPAITGLLTAGRCSSGMAPPSPFSRWQRLKPVAIFWSSVAFGSRSPANCWMVN